ENAEPDAVDAGIVGDHRQILDAGLTDRLDQRLRNAAEPETAGHDQHAVFQEAGERRLGVGIELFHAFLTLGRSVPRRTVASPLAGGFFYRAAARAAIVRPRPGRPANDPHALRCLTRSPRPPAPPTWA